MSYEVLAYRPEFKPAALDLLAHAWTWDSTRNAACFAWKFEENPYFERPLLHLVLHAGQVVGMRALHGAHWLRGPDGPPLRILNSGDFVVHPAHRGRHLFGRLAATAAADARALGYRHILSLSATPVTYLQAKRAGFRDLGAFGTLHRPGRTIRSLRRASGLLSRHRLTAWLPRTLRACVDTRHQPDPDLADRRFQQLEAALGRKDGRASKGVTLSREPRPQPMADLFARIRPHDAVHHVRDARYLAWRFRNPLSAYRFLYWGEANLEGCLVLQTHGFAHRDRVRIVLCEASDPVIRTALLRTAIERGGFADLRIWEQAVSPPERQMLTQFGFVEVELELKSQARHRRSLLSLDLDRNAEGSLPSIEGWRVSMIDSDKC